MEEASWPTAERRLEMDIPPSWIPIAGMVMVLGIIAIIFWYKARERELQFHQDMRIREMEHQRKMRELELELEKEKNRHAAGKAG
jgi:predicted histidine transporter YuiF (NhaC family)